MTGDDLEEIVTEGFDRALGLLEQDVAEHLEAIRVLFGDQVAGVVEGDVDHVHTVLIEARMNFEMYRTGIAEQLRRLARVDTALQLQTGVH